MWLPSKVCLLLTTLAILAVVNLTFLARHSPSSFHRNHVEGRPYLQKMSSDYTDLLYYLQQERSSHPTEQQSMRPASQMSPPRPHIRMDLPPRAHSVQPPEVDRSHAMEMVKPHRKMNELVSSVHSRLRAAKDGNSACAPNSSRLPPSKPSTLRRPVGRRAHGSKSPAKVASLKAAADGQRGEQGDDVAGESDSDGSEEDDEGENSELSSELVQ
jgi:hypothetical protein